jgi:hypothetical protein
MILSNEEMETYYFRFLNGEISLEDFEQWLYATPELETYLGETAYFELVSFNFHQPAVKYELFKLLDIYTTPAEFYTWQLKQLLKSLSDSLLDNTLDQVEVFEGLYNMYSKGYYLLSDVGLEFLLETNELPKRTAQHLWDEKEYKRLREALEKYLILLKEEVEIALPALESGDLKIINQHEYRISPVLDQKLKAIHLNQVYQAKQDAPKAQKK